MAQLSLIERGLRLREENGFVWTPHMTKTVVILSVVPAAAALAAASSVLVFAGVLYMNPATRPAVKRQSFRLLLAVQVASLISSIAYIAETFMTAPTPTCTPFLISGLLANNFLNYTISLIAVNLQLVIVHNINTSGFTKWYFLGAGVLTLAGVLPSALSDVWGWDAISNSCWIKLTDPNARNAWTVGTEYVPNLMASSVAFICTITVLWHLLAVRIRLRGFFKSSRDNKSIDSRSTLVRRVTLRIIWYPLIMTASNSISMAANMTTNANGGVNTTEDYYLWCVYAFFFGALPFFYALVALFLDPTFSAAIRSHILKSSLFSRGATDNITQGATRTPQPVELELNRVYPSAAALDDEHYASDGGKEPRHVSRTSLSTLDEERGKAPPVEAAEDVEGGEVARPPTRAGSLRRRMGAVHENHVIDVYML